MMCIFYIDWQQYWKCDWILNIVANAHGKRTVSTKQPQHDFTSDRLDSQASSDIPMHVKPKFTYLLTSSDIEETCVLSMLS